jgi:hypothetical protein
VLRPKTNADAVKLYEQTGLNAVVPLDDFLKLTGLPFKLTPNLMLNTAYWAQNQGSYQEAEEAILRAYGVKVNDDTVRKVANYVGNVVFQVDCERANAAYEQLNQGKLKFPTRKKNGVLYIEADGAALNTRIKDNDGSTWRENKLGMVFSSDNIYTWTNHKGEKQRQLNKREYTAYIGAVTEFKKHLFACALKNGYGKYEKTVLISDGATWIRNMKEELFPNAQQILDFYHLCENVNAYAKCLFGQNPAQYESWATETCALLKKSKWQNVLNDLENRKKPVNCTIDLYGYIQNNAPNIDYAAYLRAGYFIGSGAIESGNKSVLQQRLKQAGMRWNVHTAQNLLTLRAKYKSNLWVPDVEYPILNLLDVSTSQFSSSTS